MKTNHGKNLHIISQKSRPLFEKIVKTPVEKRGEILKDLGKLKKMSGLKYALLALYKQQVNSGFVLAEILRTIKNAEKEFFDPDTNIKFRFQWNPNRELRKNHALLIERGIVKNIDKSELINDGCYLCKANIDKQNPREILLEIEIAGEKLYAGANFAPITNNHFTIMNAVHCPQNYQKKTLTFLNGIADETNGRFRAIFNGTAGASIEGHEHMQATTERFPIEQIKIDEEDIIYEGDSIRISRPLYYIPLWIVEGKNRNKNEKVSDEIITKWHKLDEEYHTENIIATKYGDLYRTFIILRDKRKLVCTGKKGAMGAFETGGFIVLSYEPKDNSVPDINEREYYNSANLETIRYMLNEISPEKQAVAQLSKTLNFIKNTKLSRSVL